MQILIQEYVPKCLFLPVHEPHKWIRKAVNTRDLSLLSEMK